MSATEVDLEKDEDGCAMAGGPGVEMWLKTYNAVKMITPNGSME